MKYISHTCIVSAGHLWRLAVTATVLGAPALASAQAPALPAPPELTLPEPEKTYPLELGEDAARRGRKVAMEGVAAPEGDHFTVAGLDLAQPVAVVVAAREPARPIEVQLFKVDWSQVRRSATTDAEGMAALTFRTAGELRIRVRSAGEQPAPYFLVVRVDKPAPAHAPQSLFVPMKRDTTGAAVASHGARSVWTTALLGAIALLLAGIFVRLGRPKRAMVLIVAGALPLAALGNPVADVANAVLPPSVVQGGNLANGMLTKAENWAENLTQLAQPPDRLTPEDDEYQQILDTMPRLPSNAALDPKCAECFEPAHQLLLQTRLTLEDKRQLYTSGRKKFELAIKIYVDTISSLPFGVIVAMREKAKLDNELARLDAAYDKKINELLADLKTSLEQISACEQRCFGEADWYNRFGFIYYQFMAEHYRR